jgi:hypothetical protein
VRSRIAAVLLGAAVLTGAYASGGGGADFYVATTGSDSNPGTQAQPFLTMDKCADQARSSAITCEMAAGTYPAQTLNDSAGARTALVTFRPASGATVTVPTITNGDLATIAHDGQEFVKVAAGSGTMVVNYFTGSAGTNQVTLDGLDMKSASCFGCTSWTVTNSDIGPCTAPAEGNCNIKIDADDGAVPVANSANITITASTIHDITSTDLGGSHIECVFLRNGDGITISRSKFYGCHLYSIFVQKGTSAPTNVTIENNFFDLGLDGTLDYSPGDARAIAFSGGTTGFSGFVIRHNSFPSTAGVQWDDDSNGSAPACSGCVYAANIGKQVAPSDGPACYSGVAYSANVFQSGATTCGTGDTTAASFSYVNNGPGSGIDFHLTGASWAADGIEPTCTVSVDFDNATRPGSNCDAGADER